MVGLWIKNSYISWAPTLSAAFVRALLKGKVVW